MCNPLVFRSTSLGVTLSKLRTRGSTSAKRNWTRLILGCFSLLSASLSGASPDPSCGLQEVLTLLRSVGEEALSLEFAIEELDPTQNAQAIALLRSLTSQDPYFWARLRVTNRHLFDDEGHLSESALHRLMSRGLPALQAVIHRALSLPLQEIKLTSGWGHLNLDEVLPRAPLDASVHYPLRADFRPQGAGSVQQQVWNLGRRGDISGAQALEARLATELRQGQMVRSRLLQTGTNGRSYHVLFESGLEALLKESTEPNQESLAAEIYAWGLDRMIGLYMVPLTVERRLYLGLRNVRVSLQLWVRAGDYDETADSMALRRAEMRARFFDTLIFNRDRRFGAYGHNVIRVGNDLALIDHGNAFSSETITAAIPTLRAREMVPPPEVFERLRGLSGRQIADYLRSLDPPLSNGQIETVLNRRAALVTALERAIGQSEWPQR